MPLRPDQLRDRGWTDPLDDSPIETADGWHHGRVVHTGGSIYCRIWHSQDDPTADATDGDQRFEMVYGDTFDGVAIEGYEYNSETERWEHDETVILKRVAEQTDTACAEAAREMMTDHPPDELADS
jgi:hypothetical protein